MQRENRILNAFYCFFQEINIFLHVSSEPHSAFPAQNIKARRRSFFMIILVFSRAKIQKIVDS